MIVTPHPAGGLRIIRQSAHARAAARIASHWKPARVVLKEQWPHLLDAVRHHDDGWDDAELAPRLTPDGRPHDFKSIPTLDHIAIWRSSFLLSCGIHPYTGLLVALHARWLYTHFHAADGDHDHAAALRFLGQLNHWIDSLVRHHQTDRHHARHVEPHRLEAARRLVTFLDQLSLAMTGAITPTAQPGGLHFGGRSCEIRVRQNAADPDVWHLVPWPFEVDQIDVTMPAVHVRRTRFDSPLDAWQAIDQAESSPWRGQLRSA